MIHRYTAPDNVPRMMRDWFNGKTTAEPHGVWFECGRQVTGHVRELRQAPAAGSPSGTAADGGLVTLIDLPVIGSEKLPGDAWKLTTPVSFDGGYTYSARVTVREGQLGDGKPTALERGYWLVDFHGVYRAAWDYAYLGDWFVRNRLGSLVEACGHDAATAHLKITQTPGDSHWDDWTYHGTMSVPREPVRYPQCGDWLCRDDADWTEADPVDDPAAFAGAATEKRYVDRLREDDPRWFLGAPDYFRDMMTCRRRRADGNPLWTIDIRSAAAR